MTWICLVDDHADTRDVLADALRAGGHEVRAFAHGSDALEAIDRAGSSPALVILDLLLPGMAGPDVLRAIRAGRRVPRVPVIVVTGIEDAEAIVAPLHVNAILSKPIPLPTLLAAVAKALSSPVGDDER